MTTREQLVNTLNTYCNNATRISPEDLNGRYKIAFDNLKHKLLHEADEYFINMLFWNRPVKDDDEGKEFASQIRQVLDQKDYYGNIRSYLLHGYDLSGAENYTMRVKEEINYMYDQYLQKHLCLSVDSENPFIVRIYNDLTGELAEMENA